MKARLPFLPQWKQLMLDGVKICTARTKPAGKIGDTFEAFGAEFEIVGLEVMPLFMIAAMFYKEEGCHSPEGFEAIYQKIHPRRGFRGNDTAYLHTFKRLT